MKRAPLRNGNKGYVRKRPSASLAAFRSAVTNGSSVLLHVDGRSAWMRRFRDLIAAHEADLGGRDILSEGQRAIVRRAALLQCQLELMETRIAQNDGEAGVKTIECYQRTSGAMRRLLESLGLHQGRKQRDVTPDLQTYLHEKRFAE
jgi:hypothetical protein